MEQDPQARVAVETLVTRGLVVIAGEVTFKGHINPIQIARDTIIDIGYNRPELGFDGNTCGVVVALQAQSPDIARGVDIGGAGDQGIMYGYATPETPELMPLPIAMAHALMYQVTATRTQDPELGFLPDAKGQISITYENGIPQHIHTLVLSVQHMPHLTHEEVCNLAKQHIIDPVLKKYSCFFNPSMKLHINPTGAFTIGGPQADTGLTGRKIIMDTYGGLCPHGGGSFSGKDATKVDRSSAYMARHLAKCIVAAGLAERAQVALAYAIGVEQPVAINLEMFGTEHEDIEKIEKKIRTHFDLSPRGIIKHLKLHQIKYLPTARYGHFGYPEFPWEDTMPASALKD
jgi:S-adenosylmethionine synthetase